MASVQMNVRIPEDIKREGDIGIKNAGYTPSQVCNMIWEYAAKNINKPNVIKKKFTSIKVEEEKNDNRLNKFHDGINQLNNFFKEHEAILSEIKIPEMSNSELHDYIAQERIKEYENSL